MIKPAARFPHIHTRMSLRYIERVDGLYDGKMRKMGPLSLSDDILANLANMVGVEEFEFLGEDAPTHLITGFPDSLRRLCLSNWAGLTEGAVRDLAARNIECLSRGVESTVSVHGHFFTYEYPYMRAGEPPVATE